MDAAGPAPAPGGPWRSPAALLAIAGALLALPIGVVQLFRSSLYGVMGVDAYLGFHNVAELFSIVISFAIFAVGWFTHGQSGDRHALFLACVFLSVGLQDLMHTLAYSGMPAFITPSSVNKASQLWIAARFHSALAFLASAFVLPESRSRWLSRPVLLAAALVLSGAVLLAVTGFPERLPAAFVPGVGQTSFKLDAEYATIALLLLSVGAYLRRQARTGEPLLLHYAAAFLFCALAEVAFAVYASAYDTFNAIGHVYKVLAFALVFRAGFMGTVLRPYQDLLAKRDALRRQVAERRAAEQALLASQRTLAESEGRARRERDRVVTIMETSPVAMAQVAGDGAITYANAQAERLLGAPREALVGQRWDSLGWSAAEGGRELPAAERPLARLVSAGRLAAEGLGLVRADGSRVLLRVEAALLLDESGSPSGGVFALEDSTERRRLEDQLRQSQKLEAVGRLAGGVAHDFNNLLTVILSGCSFLMAKAPEGNPLREDAQDIEAAAQRAAALTRQLLTFSRRQVVQPRVVDLDGIVAGLERMLRRLIGEDIDLAVVAGSRQGRVRIDPGQLEQVIVNLAINARDAMSKGGRLTIETSDLQAGAEEPGRLGTVPSGRYLVLAVGDTGCGMGPEVQAHLFEPFFTTKEQGKGTGLGLSTVYGIAKQAGGDVWVQSEPGRGTVVKVLLPRVDEPATAGAGDTAAPPPRGTETILLAEDDPLVRHLAARALRAMGYTVLEARDGAEAEALASGAGARPIDLLVTDVVMPRMGGPQLADALRRRSPGLRVLFVSGYAEHGKDLEDRLQGGSALLQKPFTQGELCRQVRLLLDGSVEACPAAQGERRSHA